MWAAAAGMGNANALAVATIHGAKFLGLERELGSLSTGKVADLLVLNENPLDDIRDTAKIAMVVKNGTIWDAATLDQVWPQSVPFGDYYWVNPDALRTDDRPGRLARTGADADRASTAVSYSGAPLANGTRCARVDIARSL